MTIPTAGYEYEADAVADGVLHYWPFYDLFTGLSSVDIVGEESLTTYNDSAGITLEKDMFGYCRNLTANGTLLNHSVLVKEADSTVQTILYDWTVALWIRPTTLTYTDTPVILDTTYYNGFKVFFGSSGSATIDVTFTNGSIAPISIVASPTVATDHLIVITNDNTAGELKLYLDNVLQDTRPYSQALSLYDARWIIGCDNTSNLATNYFDGRVDELSIFDRAITVTEVSTLWNVGAGMIDDLVKHANKPRVFPTETVDYKGVSKHNFLAVATSILGANVTNAALLKAAAIASDAPDVGETITAVMRALPIASEDIGLEDVFVENLRVGRSVSEDFGFIASFSVSGETYDGVVMNTQNDAVTEYDQVPYNSMAQVGIGVYAAVAGDGIYYMEGGLDDTANIDAYITTKLMNFGESKFKRVERAYVAMSNDGPMALKVITRNALGTLSEDWYELTNTSDTMRTDRIKIGKGLKSHYWQFTLANNAGADFDLSELNFQQIKLSRRV